MLGLFLLYFIGKSFYELAHEYDKSRWGFAIAGVVAYYFGTFVAGILFYLLDDLGLWISMENLPDIAVG
jgi:hypothetical protein